MQLAQGRPDDHDATYQIIAIVKEKREEIMARQHAGYFIRDWHELTDQVRQLIFKDPRCQAIKSNRATKIEVK